MPKPNKVCQGMLKEITSKDKELVLKLKPYLKVLEEGERAALGNVKVEFL